MANERITENIVRSLLREKGYYDDPCVIIEEQKSKTPRIDKLLKNASKKGNSNGRPEFIISFPNKDFLIIIECKANIKNHRSRDLNQYDKYAIDGVLLYTSYLSQGFNVLAIGVSGESDKELKIDTYLQLQGEKQARDLNIKSIYQLKDYYALLNKDCLKEKADFEKLMRYSKMLNQNLRDDFEFEETHRPLIVSGILLALEDVSFCSAYHKKSTSLEIANLLITTIKERLEHDNIGATKKIRRFKLTIFSQRILTLSLAKIRTGHKIFALEV